MNASIRPTPSTATVSLVFGILCWFVLPLVGAVIAIITGHLARSEIARSRGALGGDGAALTGLILGYVHLAFAVLALLAIVLFFGGVVGFLTFLAALASHHG